jgi:hypothetical protein
MAQDRCPSDERAAWSVSPAPPNAGRRRSPVTALYEPGCTRSQGATSASVTEGPTRSSCARDGS